MINFEEEMAKTKRETTKMKVGDKSAPASQKLKREKSQTLKREKTGTTMKTSKPKVPKSVSQENDLVTDVHLVPAKIAHEMMDKI